MTTNQQFVGYFEMSTNQKLYFLNIQLARRNCQKSSYFDMIMISISNCNQIHVLEGKRSYNIEIFLGRF